MLSDLFEWKNTCFPYKDYSTFNLNKMTASKGLSAFRFGKRDPPIAVFHIKFISSVLKINDLPYQIAGWCDSTLFGICILIPQYKYIRICHWETIFQFFYFKIMVKRRYQKRLLPWNPRACKDAENKINIWSKCDLDMRWKDLYGSETALQQNDCNTAIQ